MNCRINFVASILLISFILSVGPGHACLKKVRTLLRNKGKEEQPAELVRDEAAFIKYSHAERSNFYLEILHHENNTLEVRELNHAPITMNQVKMEEIQDKKLTPEEPDAEYIDTNQDGESISAQPTNGEEITTENSEIEEEETTTSKPKKEGEESEEILSPEDAVIRKEWQGRCMASHWNHCNKIRQIVVIDVINNQFMRKNLELDCIEEKILCLRNGWTANRCHILCMASKTLPNLILMDHEARCNKNLYLTWDEIVDFEGPCRYRK